MFEKGEDTDTDVANGAISDHLQSRWLEEAP